MAVTAGTLVFVSVEFVRTARYRTRRQTESHRTPRYRVRFQLEGQPPHEAMVGPNPKPYLIWRIRESRPGDTVEVLLSDDGRDMFDWTNTRWTTYGTNAKRRGATAIPKAYATVAVNLPRGIALTIAYDAPLLTFELADGTLSNMSIPQSTHDQINEEIYVLGPLLFEEIRRDVFHGATAPLGGPNVLAHKSNKRLLMKEITALVRASRWNANTTPDALWKNAWHKIAYAGTQSDRVTNEVQDMTARIPLFQNFRNYDATSHRFDKASYEIFTKYWKRRYFWYSLVRKCEARAPGVTASATPVSLAQYALANSQSIRLGQSTKDELTIIVNPLAVRLSAHDPRTIYISAHAENWAAHFSTWKGVMPRHTGWLDFAKSQPDFVVCASSSAGCGSEVLAWMTKGVNTTVTPPADYTGIAFAANPPKVKKYVELARTLQSIGTSQPVLRHFLGAYTFNRKHLTGTAYKQDKRDFWGAHANLHPFVGDISALHLMMDLGLKTIKPDRVMTYLFYRLGWLLTLPPGMSKDEVMEEYANPDVIDEMLHRADVLAASLESRPRYQRLSRHGMSTHRLLDIWFVKYGQVPEKSFGLTKNLADIPLMLEHTYAKLIQTFTPGKNGFSNQWPFTPRP